EALRRQVLDGRGGPHQVDDRVDRPHLMEVDVLQGHSMRLGLGLSQALEQTHGPVLDRRSQSAPSDQLADLRQPPVVSVVVLMSVFMSVVMMVAIMLFRVRSLDR